MAKNKKQQKKQRQKEQRQEAKQQARQAAASGNYSKSNTKALRQAGVKSSKIQTIKSVARDVRQTNRSTAQQTQQTNNNATQARSNPIYQNPGFQDSVQKQMDQGQAIGQAFYDSPEFAGARGDLTNQQVADYVMSQGGAIGDQWLKDFGTETTEAQTLKQVMKGGGKTKLGALLKIAAGQDRKKRGQDLVDNREFRQIYKHFDKKKNGLKITSKMDKINAKQADKENGYNPMGVQNRTLKGISDNKYGDARDLVWGRMSNATLGDALQGKKHGGALSQLAINYKGSALDGMDKNRAVYGADANGNPIFAPGTGKSWSEHKLNQPTTSTYKPWYEPPGKENDDGGGGGGNGNPNPNPNPNPQDPTTPGFGTGGTGDSGMNNALTFRQAKSRWKANGRAYKGTSGLKYSRSAGFGGFGASAATF